MELLMIREKLWSVISSPTPNPVTADWTQKDGEARALIGLSVEDNQLGHVRKEKLLKNHGTI